MSQLIRQHCTDILLRSAIVAGSSPYSTVTLQRIREHDRLIFYIEQYFLVIRVDLKQ